LRQNLECATVPSVADLAALRELYAWMRQERISYARAGELELRIELPPPQVVPGVPTPSDPVDDERRSLETLLHSSGADPDLFLAAMRKVA
jgi:hypothetical protein